MRALLMAALVCSGTGCATQYAYRFQQVTPTPGDLQARLQVSGDAIRIDVGNRTTEVAQIAWNKIELERGDGTHTRLRPAADVGWIQPGAWLTADLVPVAFPTTGAAAKAYEGRRLELVVPAIVKREPVTYRFAFIAHVEAL